VILACRLSSENRLFLLIDIPKLLLYESRGVVLSSPEYYENQGKKNGTVYNPHLK
jgi:hypothetical protein